MSLPLRELIVVLASLMFAGLTEARQEQDKHQAEILSWNSVFSDDAIEKKWEELEKDRKKLRELVKAGQTLLEDKTKNLNYAPLHLLGRACLVLQDSEPAIKFFLAAIDKANKVKSEMRVIRNRYMLCRAYQSANKLVEAEKLATKMSTAVPSDQDEDGAANEAIFSRYLGHNELLVISLLQGKNDKAKTSMDFLEQTFTQNPWKNRVLQAKARMLHFQGNIKKAIAIIEEISEEAEDQDEKEQLKEILGNYYADSGDPAKGSQMLEELLKKKPEDAGLNNDLGFILANHDMRLDEAEKMCRKAVELDPENSSYLDSLAWVFFKKKNYEEARKYQEKALSKQRARNAELYDHYADILAALNMKKEAIDSYKKSIENVTPSDHDQKIKTKAQEKLKKLEEAK